MSRSLLNKATCVLLVAATTVLNSAEPARNTCSVADLDGDCDVDLADYAVFQREFSGETSFNLVGEVWDVYFFRESEQRWVYSYYSWRFYLNGTMDANAESTGTPDLKFYDFDGNTVTIALFDYSLGNDNTGCPGQVYVPVDAVVTFVSPDRMDGGSFCEVGGQQTQSLMVLRRF